jgi:hypothetical protein
MDDRVRSSRRDGLPHRIRVEQVEHDRLRSEGGQTVGFCGEREVPITS